MRYSRPNAVVVSAINAAGWDADLVVPAARRITVDHIGETTGAHNIVLDNTETGRQIGTGNSATGAVLAFTESFAAAVAITADQRLMSVRVKRSGTYKVKIYNRLVMAGGNHIHFFVNAVDTDSTAAGNAADTDEDIGDQALAVGDIVSLWLVSAVVIGQVIMLSFYNADGMW